MIEVDGKQKEFSIELFRTIVFKRFVILVEKYAKYMQENAETLEVCVSANTITGNHFKEVISESAFMAGGLMETINLMVNVVFRDILHKNKADYNPQTATELMISCGKIIAALKPYMEIEHDKGVVAYTDNDDCGDVEIIYGDW